MHYSFIFPLLWKKPTVHTFDIITSQTKAMVLVKKAIANKIEPNYLQSQNCDLRTLVHMSYTKPMLQAHRSFELYCDFMELALSSSNELSSEHGSPWSEPVLKFAVS